MNFYDQLQQQTQAERDYLLSSPIINDVWERRIDLNLYVSFLTNAYHHVRHTARLMLSAGAELQAHQLWIIDALSDYIAEEKGHEEWILNDLAACGQDKQLIRDSEPDTDIEMMVAFLYDYVNRRNAMGIFGMVQVLEGTSVALATEVARIGQEQLKLPNTAFTYLRSHGSLDIDHLKFFEKTMNKVTDKDDQQAILHCAKTVYKLYGQMYRNLPRVEADVHAA